MEAEPSGNAIHCENLLRLYQLTLNRDYLTQAEDILKAVKKYMDNYSPGYCYHIMNLNRYYDKHAPTLVIALDSNETHKEIIKHTIFMNFIPHKAVVWRREKEGRLNELFPYISQQVPQEGKTTLYICHEGVCLKPLNEINEIQAAIQKL